MPRRSHQDAPETIRQELINLLSNFKNLLPSPNLRAKVQALVPTFHLLRDLGCSLIPKNLASSARKRILYYFQKYPCSVIPGEEIMVVAGINDWARRVRELRVEFGWPIVSGVTAKEMSADGEFPVAGINPTDLATDDYILVEARQDRDAAHRWHVANEIRGEHLSIRDSILKYLRLNVGKPVTGEELRYVAGDRQEWPRRVRELRTELGWPIATKVTGRPDLPVGAYILEADRQMPAHDRNIPDPVRVAVLQRDGCECVHCQWRHEKWNRSDPRHLELHHKQHHVHGGANTEDNLETVCTVCHDDIHRKERR
ncbi:MAG: HNH endonuclease [Verrucomicrobia bacterium]|nr:HNH endonuclease [Verrucomicrobiota bacterium]